MDDLPKVNSVRAIIDLFEDNCRNETAHRLNKPMSKSFAGLSFAERKLNSHPSTDNEAMVNINQRLDDVTKRLKDYRTYAKDAHLAIHEQLMEIIVYLSNLEVKGNTMKYRKRELMMDLKACFRELNDKLPRVTEKAPQGFGDSTYKPFMRKSSGLIDDTISDHKIESNSGYLENIPSSPRVSTSPRPVSFSPDNPNTGATKRLVEEFEIFRRNGDLLTPSSLKKSTVFLTGGAVGGKRPLYANGIDSALRGTSDIPKTALHRSSSEKADNVRRIPSVVRARRRPVSLGGSVVTLSSPQHIISNIKFPQTSELPTNNEEVIDDENLSNQKSKLKTENEDSFQSVNLLKKYFEMNSTEKEDCRTEKLSNTKNDQKGGDFALYVRNIEKSLHNESSSTEEDSVEESSNDTVFEVVQNDDVKMLSRSSSIKVGEVEELNSSVLRGEVIDDGVDGKSVKAETEEGDFSDYMDSEECGILSGMSVTNGAQGRNNPYISPNY